VSDAALLSPVAAAAGPAAAPLTGPYLAGAAQTVRTCPAAGPERPRWARLSRSATRRVIARWCEALGVRQTVRTERISRFQVTGEAGRPGASLVGVRFDAEQAVIYHTRALTEEDVVHELLHVAFPHWSEAEVRAETARLCPAGQAEAA